MDFAAKFRGGLSYRDFLTQYGTPDQQSRWQAVWDKIVLTPDQIALLGSFRRQMKVLCVAGTWCGDCVNQCPIFWRFEEVCPALQIRYFDRDANPDLAQELSVCGAARVPSVLFLSEDDFPCGRYGDRTLSKYRQMAAELLGPACPSGLVPPEQSLLSAVTQDWLNEFERIQLILRTSGRLRQLHGD